MSELSFWEQLKQIKAALSALSVAFVGALAVGGFIIDWVIDVKVNAALSALDIGTDAKIVSMDTGIADNKRTGAENAKDIEQNRQRVEAAFRALLKIPEN